MPSNALTQTTIRATLSTLQGDGPADVSPRDGLSIIDDWLKVIGESQPAATLRQELMQLRSMLMMPNPDTDQLKQLLGNLSYRTHMLAQNLEGPWVNDLEQIAQALNDFGNQL
ncbi:hypothetical protein [Larkinella soli]|uniref:hypothetical protein n=1 Tax=Larkinella soli TaxID=1770527 RepID=UPI000FFBDF2B|nr:hypothetical protein [Larkinella soli]